MNNPLAIETKNLLFYYITPKKMKWLKHLPLKKVVMEKKVALNHVNFLAKRGKITALLGRNGSGKTSLIKVVTGARFPQFGEIWVFGQSPAYVRSSIGLCLGDTLIYYRLTGRENLEYFGKLYGVQKLKYRISELGELLGLSDQLDQMVESYSFGMKAKLAFARSLIHSPELLILDEPTLGIDLELATHLRQFIRSLSCTVLFTTHYMEEADLLADNVCFIDKGVILAQGTREEVLRSFGVSTLAQAYQVALGVHAHLEEAA